MSLRLFHRFFIGLCLILLSFTAYWANGSNPAGLVTPWLLYASIAGSAATLGYLYWHLKTIQLPQ
jgi:hypothetical protein